MVSQEYKDVQCRCGCVSEAESVLLACDLTLVFLCSQCTDTETELHTE